MMTSLEGRRRKGETLTSTAIPDSHFIIQNLAKKEGQENISVIDRIMVLKDVYVQKLTTYLYVSYIAKRTLHLLI